MSSAAQVLRQAESLKASLVENSKNSADAGGNGKVTLDSVRGRGLSEGEEKEGGKKGVWDLWVTRQKLEDVYKRLLLMDLEYALDKKVEQDLWNHAFKNQITALQTQAKEKQNPKKVEVQANLNLFLETASGFYLQFLQLICSTFKLDLPFRRKSSAFGVMKEKTQLRAKITPPKRSSCLYICQYCLVHLGDIARYRQQTEQAQTYYRHAVNLSPQNGQPYNQLAILEVNRNNKLSSVFYYVRSLAVRHPFPAAATNLEKFYTKLIKDTSEFKGKMAQNEFVNAFLQFQALLHLSADLSRASYLCSRILSCLPTHLLSQTFSASVLVQCVAITIFTLNHLRHVPSGGDTSATTSPKGDNLAGGEKGGADKGMPQVDVLLSTDEQKSLDIILAFTASVLELLIQHTPVVGVKARESPTLPPVQVLLDWLAQSPDIITLHPFTTSNIWGHLAKMLNVIQQYEDGKPNIDLSKYDDVPLPEDTELRCFQPIEKAHSKYSFSGVPVDGFPRGVEEHVRCVRLVKQGKSISEDFPQLKMTAIQQNDPPRINFSGPLLMKNTELMPPSSQERRAKQNVAMQAIMKHGQGGQPDSGRPGNKEGGGGEQSFTKYLLGTATSEPQFMKHGGGGGGSGRVQTSPQLSPGFARRGQSPQTRPPSSPMPAFTSPPVTSPRPTPARVASPVSPLQQQQSPPPQAQHRAQLMSNPVPVQPEDPSQQACTQSQKPVASPHGGSMGYQPSPSPTSKPNRNQLPPQHPYLANLPFQGPAPGIAPSPGQGHSRPDQGHLPGQVHMAQSQGFQGQGMSSMQGRGEQALGPSPKPGQGTLSQYPPYPLPFPPLPGDPFQASRMTSALATQPNVHPQLDASRMQHFPSGQSATSSDPTQSPAPSPGPRHTSPNHPLNAEMLSALRLASQISHPQTSASAPGEVSLHVPTPQQSQQDQCGPPTLFRPPIQRPPVVAHATCPHTGGPGPPSPRAPGSFSAPNLPRPFHTPMGLATQRPPADIPMHAFSTTPRPHPRMHGAMATRGHDLGLGQGSSSRLPAPPIPMPGQGSSGFPGLMTGLFQEDGGGRGEGGRSGYQALSPLTIQPPKSSPPDTRISTSFQGHAEGTPKPDKQEVLAPESREGQPTVQRVVMPVGQPGGEYSLFASSSPWSMPLNSSSDSKSMASSPLSSQDSSMRNSPVVGLEPLHDLSTRHKVVQGEGWMGQGQGYDELRSRGQGPPLGNSLWMEAAAMTPLERLLEQQRLQRQTDPH